MSTIPPATPPTDAVDPKQAAYDALNDLLNTATAAANNPANTQAARDTVFALRTASEVCLPGDLTLRAITAPYFLGTKIEAFRGRGREDYFASHDLEDLITVVDGRPSLLNEVEAASVELRRFIGEAVQALLTEPRFLDALPGYLLPDEANQARIVQLTGRLRVLGRLA